MGWQKDLGQVCPWASLDGRRLCRDPMEAATHWNHSLTLSFGLSCWDMTILCVCVSVWGSCWHSDTSFLCSSIFPRSKLKKKKTSKKRKVGYKRVNTVFSTFWKRNPTHNCRQIFRYVFREGDAGGFDKAQWDIWPASDLHMRCPDSW